MLQKYIDWILSNVENAGYGECHPVCLFMQKTFPELELRKGFFHSNLWGRRQHWWLRTKEGEIVDPTFAQFPVEVGFDNLYQDLTDLPEEELAEIVPSGVCMNCGDDIFQATSVQDLFCSEPCHQSVRRDMGL